MPVSYTHLDVYKRQEQDGYEVTYLTPDRDGNISADAVLAAVRTDTALVLSLIHI